MSGNAPKLALAVVVIMIAFAIIGAVGPFSVSAAVSPGSRPMIRAGTATSTNWAGYAVTSPAGSVTDAKGSWTVPTLSCGSSTTYVALWVGIDGYSDSTVEQTGILGQCSNGVASYSAWYEFYPNPSFTISGFTVKPGDIVSADVSYSGRFTVTLTDGSQSFATSKNVHSAQRSSAEWIAEAPSSGGSILALANFGTSYFGSDYTAVPNTNYATINGVTGTIASFGSSVQEITMVSSSTNPSSAQPSALSSDGTSFSVAYVQPSSTTTTSSTSSSTTSTTSTTTTSSGASLTVGVSTDKSSYTQSSWAYITVTVTSSGTAVSSASVTVTVTNPNGGVASGSGTTNSAGQVTFKYRIGPNAPVGTYTVDASASASGYTSGSGSNTFTVT
ncbi:MAG: G1 family endopeptidase [Thaumarchaeota archaeon]|nr:G1 family endopeptidase [Nitrososphaerota archaeon]